MIDFHRETACGNLRLRSVGRKHCADPETTMRAKAVSQQQPRSTAHEAHDGLGIVTSAVRLRGHVEHNSQLPTSHVPGYVIFFFSFSLLRDLFFCYVIFFPFLLFFYCNVMWGIISCYVIFFPFFLFFLFFFLFILF